MPQEEQAVADGHAIAHPSLEGAPLPPDTGRPPEEELARRFADEMGWGDFRANPLGRAIFDFLCEASAACDADSVVLDVSAGQCRYKPFFRHARYLAIDSCVGDPGWDYSRLDLLGEASELPVKTESVDVGLNFTSLEHYPDPELVFAELSRVLRPGGELFLYVPCNIPEHQAPYDFHRFTRFALARLTENAGLLLRSLRPTNGIYYTALNLLVQAIHTVHDAPTKTRLTVLKDQLAPLLLELDRGEGTAVEYPDTSPIPQWPAAYCLRATKPGRPARPRHLGDRRELLQEVVACPRCQGNLIWWNDRTVCAHCSISFPITNGIADLTPSDPGSIS